MTSRTYEVDNLAIIIAGMALALALRLALSSFVSADMEIYVGPWFDILQAQGVRAIGTDFSNYSPPYLYLLYLASILLAPLPDVVAIKLVSILFDFILAGFVYLVVRHRYPDGPFPLFAFLTTLFVPTVVANSALWGQIDSLYTSGLVATLYFLITGRERLGFLAYGVAFAAKLQAIFFMPFLVILLVKRRVPWWGFALIPLVYLLTVLPAWLLGRPLGELLTIYLSQVDTFQELALNIPNMYAWLPDASFDVFYPAGLLWGASVVFFFIAGVYKSRVRLTDPLLIQLALLSLLIVPYFLPKMHDRYFYPADVLSLIFGFYFPRYMLVPFLVIMTSFFTYLSYLFQRQVIPEAYLALVLLVVIVFLAGKTAQDLYGRGRAGDLLEEATSTE